MKIQPRTVLGKPPLSSASFHDSACVQYGLDDGKANKEPDTGSRYCTPKLDSKQASDGPGSEFTALRRVLRALPVRHGSKGVKETCQIYLLSSMTKWGIISMEWF